jgi:hypothetical protein
LRLREYYDEVELVTDSLGKELLIDELKLPYTSVKVVLDDINGYPWQFWAIAKLISYSLQDKPFIHIDGDIFISKPFTESLEKAAIISQNLEVNFDCYHSAMKAIIKTQNYLPTEIKDYLSQTNHILASNMGIFGGNNIDFIKQFSKEALHFAQEYFTYASDKDFQFFNCVFEQFLLICMAQKSKIDIDYFTKDTEQFSDYKPISQFNKMGSNDLNYVHLVGSFKRQLSKCNTLSSVLKKEYPEYHRRVNQILGEKTKLQYFMAQFR